MDWRSVDERLIGHGMLLLSLDFLDDYDAELTVLSGGKVGRPFKLTDGTFCSRLLYAICFPCLIGSLRALPGHLKSLFQGFRQRITHGL